MRFPFFRNRDSVKNGILISIRRTGDGFHPGLFNFGLMDLDLDKCRDLFEVLDTRDGRKSTVVISQFPVSTWFDMFADNTYADACLTRITDKHHTYRLEMNGINMRETE